MVNYTIKKRVQLSCFVCPEESKVIKKFADAENRSISNYIYHKLFGEKNEQP